MADLYAFFAYLSPSPEKAVVELSRGPHTLILWLMSPPKPLLTK